MRGYKEAEGRYVGLEEEARERWREGESGRKMVGEMGTVCVWEDGKGWRDGGVSLSEGDVPGTVWILKYETRPYAQCQY